MHNSLDSSFLLLGRKWATPVLLELLSGKRNFNLILGALPGINSKTLSARLEDLCQSGLITKREIATGPHQIQYELTEKGEEFRLLARELVGFSVKWHKTDGL